MQAGDRERDMDTWAGGGRSGFDSSCSCVLSLEMQWLEEQGRGRAGPGVQEHRGASVGCDGLQSKWRIRMLGTEERKGG